MSVSVNYSGKTTIIEVHGKGMDAERLQFSIDREAHSEASGGSARMQSNSNPHTRRLT